jgi:hypothetical protein
MKENEVQERIGLLDIEASSLVANFGVMLSWVIKDFNSDYVYYDIITPDDVKQGKKDKRVVQSCVESICQFDRIVCHYIKFDVRFTRTRALTHNIPFPPFGQIYGSDTWRMAKDRLCLNSNRQDTVAETLQHLNIKTRCHPQVWLDVQFGTPKEQKAALSYVLDHNYKDVLQLEENYRILREFVHESKTSI